MTPLGQAAGYLSYNGYPFNAASRVRLSATFAYDEAERTVVGTTYTLRATTYVAETILGAGADAEILSLRQALSHPGGVLVYNGGVGGFSINAGGTTDVRYGPKPRILRLDPIANKACYELEWEVEVTIPDCANAAFTGISAFNYEVQYSIRGDTGLSVRTYSGYWEIAATRSGRRVPDTADAYRERICQIALPPGFRRLSQDYHLSKDKRRMDFTIVDEQMPGGLPPGCVDADGEQSAETMTMAGAASNPAVQFGHTLSCRYRLQPGQRLSSAYEAFYALYVDRVRLAQSAGGAVRLSSFRVSRGVYGNDRQVAFRFSYITTSSIERIIVDNGLFRPVPGTNWQQWAASVPLVLHQRGPAQLRHLAGEDLIVDLCGRASTITGFGGVDLRSGNDAAAAPVLRSADWIDHRMAVEVDVDPGVVEMKTLPADNKTLKTPSNPTASLTTRGNDPLAGSPEITGNARVNALPIAGLNPPVPRSSQIRFIPWGTGLAPAANIPIRPVGNGNVVQQRVGATLHIILKGWAARLGAPIPVPQVLTFQGMPVIAVRPQRFEQYIAGNVCGLPLYVARWYLKFLVPEVK
jgi:hypothetical protein